ncbi:MAG: response regulator [Bacteroidota bacterium]|nr:response regulator [Bacteroidota bacterium]
MQPEEILESISGGFFALDADYRFTYWNRAAEEGTGYTRGEVIGKHVFEIFPNAQDAELGRRYREAMETKTFQSFETSYRDKKFEAWYNIRIYPNENGLSVFFQDITAQKQQEQQRETVLEISHIINTSNQVDELCAQVVHTIAARYDLPFHQVLMYSYRPQDEKLILVAPELSPLELEKALVSIPVNEFQTTAIVDAAITGTAVTTTDISRSVYYSVAPEMLVTAELKIVAALPLKVESELVGVMEILFEREKQFVERQIPFLALLSNEIAVGLSRRGLIDELRVKNVDLEIQRSQTMEAHGTLKRFLAFFSHELRSPLSSIIGFTELILGEFGKLDEATLRNYVENIKTSGTHLLQLINDILDLSKMEAGKLELFYRNIPLRNFLDALRSSLQPQLEAKHLTLELAIADDLDDIVADDVRLKQILLNLITNAIKFSYAEGKIILAVRRVENNIEFSVQDFGTGIRPEEKEKLFQPFHQTSALIKREGTGLGLSITKKLVELHGGAIFVVSEWQQGSTFFVRLPMMVHAEDGTPDIMQSVASLLPPSPKEQKVLIVEDKPHARTILQSYLSETGFMIETAANGVEALEKAKTWKPDIITLDILLPVKDGWQVLKELKQHPLCKDIPVIIISMLDERNVGFGLGAVDYFVKPVQKDELLASLKKVSLSPPKKNLSPRILVIDDDRSVTDLMQVILEAEGCTVLKAFNGREGLETAQAQHPDLIILDLVMPEVSGFSVAYQLKHNPATNDIPIMIMTSMEIDDQTREQLEGFVVSLMKKSGFTKKDLLQEIAAIEGKR